MATKNKRRTLSLEEYNRAHGYANDGSTKKKNDPSTKIIIVVVIIILLIGSLFAEDNKSDQDAAQEQTAAEQEKSAADSERKQKQEAGELLPSDTDAYDIVAFCERAFRNLGYSKANISMTSSYYLPNSTFTYVIEGPLTVKINSSKQSLGKVYCQVNWKTWKIDTIILNDTVIY